jgi:hypothetical protein
MPIDATVGGVASNSYGTEAEADTYFTDHPSFDAWDAATDQVAMLIYATRLLEDLDYIGDRATTTQALEWPRIENDLYEVPFAANVIPPKLKYAQFETALWVVQSGGVAVAAGTLTSLKIGKSIEAGYSAGSSASVDTTVGPSGLPTRAEKYLKGLRLIPVLA